MIVIGGIRNWHYEVSLSTKLIHTFVQSVEKQVAESIETYRALRANGGLKAYDLSGSCDLDEEASDSLKTCRIVEVHQGLDEETWDLNELFERHFPNLHRCAALLSLWGFVEHELHKLCLLYQRENALKLSVFDVSEKGINRSINYLEKIAGLQALRESEEWQQLKALQEIRNVVAHNDGRLKGRDGKPKLKVVTAMKKIGFVDGVDELVIQQGFLSKALNISSSYFTIVGKAIDRTLTV